MFAGKPVSNVVRELIMSECGVGEEFFPFGVFVPGKVVEVIGGALDGHTMKFVLAPRDMVLPLINHPSIDIMDLQMETTATPAYGALRFEMFGWNGHWLYKEKS